MWFYRAVGLSGVVRVQLYGVAFLKAVFMFSEHYVYNLQSLMYPSSHCVGPHSPFTTYPPITRIPPTPLHSSLYSPIYLPIPHPLALPRIHRPINPPMLFFFQCFPKSIIIHNHITYGFLSSPPSSPPPFLHHQNLPYPTPPLTSLQVNGKELSRLSQEQALEALRSSRDPLLTQVLRRGPRRKAGVGGAGGGGVPVAALAAGAGAGSCVDSGTQTDISFQHILTLGKASQPRGAPPPPPSSPPLPPILEPYVLNEL